MGATGYTIFEDDMGADWSATFLKAPSAARVGAVLSKFHSVEYLDDLGASAVLCCAEIVAAALGNSVQTMPSRLDAWARSEAAHLAPLNQEASQLVDMVMNHSELTGIWEGAPEWIEYLHGLKNRLI